MPYRASIGPEVRDEQEGNAHLGFHTFGFTHLWVRHLGSHTFGLPHLWVSAPLGFRTFGPASGHPHPKSQENHRETIGKS